MGNDNASSALKFAIGLVITMIFIGIVIVAFTFGRNHANNAISAMSKDTSQLEEGRYTQYDGATITGAEVINVIERFEADTIAIAVDTTSIKRADATKKTTKDIATNEVYIMSGVATGSTKLSLDEEKTKLRDAKDPTNTKYITPSGEFYGIVNRADTGAILGISFFRVEG